jgi:tRNA A-37 threonylcarbamoyl transferase component Bud32
MDISAGNIKWQYVSDEGRACLDGLNKRKLQGDRVKYFLQRSVYRLTDGIYIKEIKYRGLRSIFKTLTGGNAAKEGWNALKMKEKGLPVPEVLAFGTQTSFGKLSGDILVTKEILNGKPFQDFVLKRFKRLCAKKKRELLKRFAGFIRSLHDAGIYHRDFHFNNVIIQEEDDTFNFFMLDLYAVRLGVYPLAWSDRVRQLGSLLAISWGLCSVSHRMRFITYYGVRLKSGDTNKRFRLIRENAARKIYGNSSARSRRSVHKNTQFHQESVNGFRIYGTQSPECRHLSEKFQTTQGSLLESLDFTESGWEDNKRKFFLTSGIYVINRYANSSLSAKLRSLFRHSVGHRLWKRIWHFPYGVIRIPQPVMMIEKKAFPVNCKAYLITKDLANAIQLPEYWCMLDEAGKRRMCASLGILLGSMHRFGVLHGNLKWENILICPVNGEQGFFFRDIDHLKMLRRSCRKKAEEDIRIFLGEMKRMETNKNNISFFIKCWQKWVESP